MWQHVHNSFSSRRIRGVKSRWLHSLLRYVVLLSFSESLMRYFWNSHIGLCILHVLILFFCVFLNWQWFLAVVTLLFLRETPPPPSSKQRGQCVVRDDDATQLDIQLCGCSWRKDAHKKIKIGEQQTQIWSAGARNASVLPLCTAMGETQIASSNGPVTVNPTLCAHVELKLLKL